MSAALRQMGSSRCPSMFGGCAARTAVSAGRPLTPCGTGPAPLRCAATGAVQLNIAITAVDSTQSFARIVSFKVLSSQENGRQGR
jgi:hypothetical protein